MNCPRCDGAVLTERERDGVTIDTCGNCRGIWLDRGELEKLIARATRDLEEATGAADDGPPSSRPSFGAIRTQPSGRGHHPPKRKRSFLESLGELFD